MRIVFKFAYAVILSLLLLGCVQSDEPKDPLQDKIGIGEGLSLEISPPIYETYTENIIVQDRSEEISSSAKYKWVKEDSDTLKTYQPVTTELVAIPAEYQTVTEMIEVKPASIEYYLIEPVYNSDGTVTTPGAVKARDIPAVKKRVTRRIVKTPARIEERPVSRRNGYVRIIKRPEVVKRRLIPAVSKPITKSRVKSSQRFLIRRPDGEIVHIFDTIDDFTTFTDSLE